MTTLSMHKLPPATLRLLQTLDAAPNKKLSRGDLCKAVNITHRGFSLLLHRVEDRNYVARHYGIHDFVELTFGGMQALAGHRQHEMVSA